MIKKSILFRINLNTDAFAAIFSDNIKGIVFLALI